MYIQVYLFTILYSHWISTYSIFTTHYEWSYFLYFLCNWQYCSYVPKVLHCFHVYGVNIETVVSDKTEHLLYTIFPFMLCCIRPNWTLVLHHLPLYAMLYQTKLNTYYTPSSPLSYVVSDQTEHLLYTIFPFILCCIRPNWTLVIRHLSLYAMLYQTKLSPCYIPSFPLCYVVPHLPSNIIRKNFRQ